MNDFESERATSGSHRRDYKDSLFRSIYGGRDERSRGWLLSLYNALSGRNYTDTTLLEITTLEDVIYMGMKNDLSFLIDNQMNLFEQQSSVNPNMPLRGLLYFAKLYQKEIAKHRLNIYGKRLVKIPAPKFIVFYNGPEEQADVLDYRLSDAFTGEDEGRDAKAANFEWTATVININRNHSEALQKKCESLYHYSRFVERVRENLGKGIEPRGALDEAVDFAISGNFLGGYFKEQKMSILGDLLTEFDQEEFNRMNRQEGYEEGVRENALANARNFLAEGDSPEKVARCCSLPLEDVLALKEELTGQTTGQA